MESGWDWIYVGNESEQVSERITGGDYDYYDYYDYYDEGNPYEDWTDLNGNTLVLVVRTDRSVQSGGFELEFKCRDQFSIPTCSQLMVHHNRLLFT